MKRALIIGAGPMGLYAAFSAARRGLAVTVLERGEIGQSLRSWGSARFFSPLSMNAPAEVLAALPSPPAGEALLTGPDMVERVLLPLARHPLLQGRIDTHTRVLAVGRAGLTRRDFPGHPLRAERRFRLLAEGPEGERTHEADLVLDASGVYGQPARFGHGGLPAPGERAAADRPGGRLLRRLDEVEDFAAGFRAGRALLVGHGHSAAHALLCLAEAASLAPDARVTWVFRSRNRAPLQEVPDDPLPERARIAAAANALAAHPPPFLAVRRADSVAALESAGARWRVRFTAGGDGTAETAEFDALAAFTGYRPDLSFLSELALEAAPATEGTARLGKALAGVTDCLSLLRFSCGDLETGEPGFHLIGSKSYGRSGAFLLQNGMRHLESILQNAS